MGPQFAASGNLVFLDAPGKAISHLEPANNTTFLSTRPAASFYLGKCYPALGNFQQARLAYPTMPRQKANLGSGRWSMFSDLSRHNEIENRRDYRQNNSRKLNCYRRQLLLDLRPNGRVYRQPRNYSPKPPSVALLQRFAEAGDSCRKVRIHGPQSRLPADPCNF
jgi:hypothetical protein